MTLQFYSTLTPQITTSNLIFSEDELIYPSANRISKVSLNTLTISQTEDEHISNITCLTTTGANMLVGNLPGDVSVFAPSGKKVMEFIIKSNLRDIECFGNFMIAVHGKEWDLYHFSLFNNDTIFDGIFLSQPTLLYSYVDPSISYGQEYHFGKMIHFYNESLFLLSTMDGSVQVFNIDTTNLDDIQVEQWSLSGNGQRLIKVVFDDSLVLKNNSMKEESDTDTNLTNETKIPENLRLWTFSTDKVLTTWIYSNGRWSIEKKTTLSRILRPICVDFHLKKNLLVIGVTGGFHLFDLNNLDQCKEDFMFSKLQNHPSLRESGRNIPITGVKFSKEGDWIAISSSRDHDLLIIYDHESKSFVLKQEAHRAPVKCIAYSHIGDIIATGDERGEIKVWDLRTRQCFVTLTAHDGPITSLKFSRPPNARDIALYSSSLDGTCRAFDLLRYRNFRTFVPPEPVAFTSMATNMSGELIAATGQEDFGVHLWNIVTSQLLDILKGHLGPITCCAFSPTADILATGSWDKTVKLWTIHSGQCMTLEHSSDVVHLAFRPDGAQIVVSTVDGNLTFWDVLNGEMFGYISVSRDIRLEGLASEERTKVGLDSQKYFTRVCYTADGQNVVGGTFNQFLNMYNVDRRTLVKQFTICDNLSLDGLVNIHKISSLTTHANIWRVIEQWRRGKEIKSRSAIPGSEENLLPRIQCDDLLFNPTNTELAVATPGGVFLFRTEVNRSFQPLEIDPNITKHTIRKKVIHKEFGKAFIMAIKLNDPQIVEDVFYCIPAKDVLFTCRSFPPKYIENLLQFLSKQLEDGRKIEYVLLWIQNMLLVHGPYIQQLNLSHINSLTTSNDIVSNSGHMAVLRSLLRSLYSNQRHLQSMCEENKSSLKYLLTFKKKRKEILTKNNKNDSKHKLDDEFKMRKRTKVE